MFSLWDLAIAYQNVIGGQGWRQVNVGEQSNQRNLMKYHRQTNKIGETSQSYTSTEKKQMR